METSKPTTRIGDILNQCGLVSQQDLSHALEVSAREGVRLGEALVRLELLDEDQLTWALGVQFDLSYVDLSDEMVDWDFLVSLPLNHLREFMLLPIARIDGTVRAVIADPTVHGRVEAIRKLFPGMKVDVQLASPFEISDILNKAEMRKIQVERSHRGSNISDFEANSVLRWITMLESGTVEHLVVSPLPCEDGLYRIDTAVAKPDEHEVISQSEVEEIVQLFDRYPSPPLSMPGGIYAIKAGNRARNRRAIRTVFLTGPSGWMLSLEAIPFEPLPLTPARPTVLLGEFPLLIKAALFEFAASQHRSESADSSGLIIALEARIDYAAEGVYQAELADSAIRVSVCQYLLEGARPQAMILEVESRAELQRIARERPIFGANPLIMIIREPVHEMGEFILPFGMKGMFIHGDTPDIREDVRRALSNGDQ